MNYCEMSLVKKYFWSVRAGVSVCMFHTVFSKIITVIHFCQRRFLMNFHQKCSSFHLIIIIYTRPYCSYFCQQSTFTLLFSLNPTCTTLLYKLRLFHYQILYKLQLVKPVLYKSYFDNSFIKVQHHFSVTF